MTASSAYAIEIRGKLPSSLASELVEFDISDRERSTILTGAVADGAALYGLLARFESLGVQLLSVHPITAPTKAS